MGSASGVGGERAPDFVCAFSRSRVGWKPGDLGVFVI